MSTRPNTEPGGAHIDEIAPDLLYGPGVVLDLSPFADEDAEFTLELIQAAQPLKGVEAVPARVLVIED